MEFLEYMIEVNVEVSFVIHINSLRDVLETVRNSPLVSRGNTHLVVSACKLSNVLAPQTLPIGQISKDGILIDAGFLLKE